MNIRDENREKNRQRKHRILFHVDDDELKFIQAKMKVMCIKNREAYLRKMAIDGQCIRYDYSQYEKEMRANNYLVSNIAKSINQIARRVNSTENIYDEDMQDIHKQLTEIIKLQRELMKFFVSITKE